VTTQFKTLFVLSIAHAYYSERCEDVAFFIPTATGQWLKNGKLLARELAGKLYVLFEADDNGTALKPIPGRTLRIGLRLVNPFFSNFTEIDTSFASSTLLYGNTAAPAALDAPAKVKLVGKVFSHVLTDGARPVTVTLKDGAGATLQTDEVTAAANRLVVSYDLTARSSGVYSVEEDFPGGPTLNAYYSDAELFTASVFGVVEVTIDNSLYAAAADLQIDFAARLETLNYYVVARNYSDAELNQLSVSDAGFVEDGRPQINFDKKLSGAFTPAEISPDLLTGGSAKVVLFQSQATVARTERARKKIQLKKNGTPLITHLPQPRPEQTNADLIIPVSKP